MVAGRCLCGAHRLELEGELSLTHHCHCSYCRKHFGSAFATLVGVAAEGLRWQRGEVIAYESSPGLLRESCAVCGSPLPQAVPQMPVFVPAGCLDDFAARPEFHIFTASKLPWLEIADGLPAFEAYPPGIELTPRETCPPRDPEGGVRGSCLCGALRYVIEGPVITARHCHCGRCRRGRGAAYASNLVVPLQSLRLTGGEDRLARYALPEARWFTQSFCSRCGGKAPTLDREREIAIVPLGGLDDPPPLPPQEHIFTADIPSWSGIHDDLPRYAGRPA